MRSANRPLLSGDTQLACSHPPSTYRAPKWYKAPRPIETHLHIGHINDQPPTQVDMVFLLRRRGAEAL